jgi:hypothetical protein
MRCYNVGSVQRAVDREDQNIRYNVDKRGCHQGTDAETQHYNVSAEKVEVHQGMDAGTQHYNVSAEKVEVAMRCYNVGFVQRAVDREDQKHAL